MKIGWIKAKQDKKSFKMWKNLGMDVFEIEELEKTDDMISELVKKHYHTIILSNEVASFSEDIIKIYNHQENINIIIAPNNK